MNRNSFLLVLFVSLLSLVSIGEVFASVLDDLAVDRLNRVPLEQFRLKSENPSDWLGEAARFVQEQLGPLYDWFVSRKDLSKEFLFGREDDYFACLPVPVSSVLPSQQGMKNYSTSCFRSNVISEVTMTDKGAVEFTLTVSDPVSSCQDFYLFATLTSVQFHNLGEGTHHMHLNVEHYSEAELWDLNTNGIRFFRFISTPVAFIADLVQTALLYVPVAVGPSVSDEIARMNVHFLKNYPQFTYEERPRRTRSVALNASEIHSGDFVGVIRMDGLDPMIAFGMGGTTGHTTVALWFDDELYICESQVQSAYWPTPNIQRTPYETWVKQANEADYNFVHVPLSEEKRAAFNLTAAQQFFYELEGTPYGYNNFLFGWLDTATDNFPCLPPDYELCLTSELVMVASGLVDRLSRNVSDLMWNQAFVHRLGLPWGTFNTTAQIYQYSYEEKSLTFQDLIQIPEQDSWVYVQGKSLVCDVFVCGVWKSAGLFGDVADKIQCTELTPADIYKLNFFATDVSRPEQCVKADPDLPYCQLGGKYRLDLIDYNTVQPYDYMDQKCPGIPPKYERPSDC